MLLLISGSVIATLNDDTNFQLRNTWELETAEYSSTRGYADCKEQLTIGITATTVTGVRTNIATLFKLQEDVAAWKQNQRTPVTMHYTPEGTTTTYRTLITDLKLTLPKDIHIAQTLRGIPSATLDYTRKGLWLSGSEGNYQTTSGTSGRIVTITGLIAQSVYSPTNFSVSGFLHDESSDPFLPEGYYFVADRTISTRPAIVVEPASGLFGSTVTVGNASVAQSTTTALIDSFATLRPSAMQMLNAYQKVHVFVVGTIPAGSYAELYYTTSQFILIAQYLQATDAIYLDSGSFVTSYAGTFNRANDFSIYDLRIKITAGTAGDTINAYQVIFVADTDGTNIIRLNNDNSNSSPIADGGGRYESQIRHNYVSSYPTMWQKQIAGFGSYAMISGTYAYQGATGDVYMQTKESTVDTLVSLQSVVANSWWYLPNTSATAHAQFLRLGLTRDKATLIPGV